MTYNLQMFTVIAFGTFGLIVGSFLNVLILRWRKRPLTGRSSCETCGETIAWYDLVPVLSWLVLLGRCRLCGSRISIQYPFVEALTAFIFIVIGAASLWLPLKILSLSIAALLVAVAFYDLRTTLIPNAWAYSFAVLALLQPFLMISSEWSDLSTDLGPLLLAGPLTALPLFAFWLFSRGAWMGFGDVKLALGMGWLLGLWGGLQALFLAFMLGGAVSAPLLFFSSSLWEHLSRKLTPIVSSAKARWGFTMKSEIPFGPFLIAATFIIWLLNMYGITFGDFFA